MSSLSAAVLDYRRKIFGEGAVIMADGTSSLNINPHLGHAPRVMILERTDGFTMAALVLTLPDVRGRGYARAVVRAIGRLARHGSHEPQYRCQVDNAASVALAESSGLALFGRWEVIRSDAVHGDRAI